MKLEQATRSNSSMRLAIHGCSGGGKTYSALQLAKGLTKNNQIAVIDTEAGSAALYSNLTSFKVLRLEQPFTPERFIEAITICENAGCDVIIIDSLSNAWEGAGGVLEIHGHMPGNSFANWSKVMPRHNSLVQKILTSSSHIIATLRAKQDYLIDQSNGKMTIQKVGLKPVQKEGIDYEFTLAFDMDMHHKASASKDRTGLFIDKDPFVITPQTGIRIKEWCNQTPTNNNNHELYRNPTITSTFQ